jgi:Phosphotransferase enzyme family
MSLEEIASWSVSEKPPHLIGSLSDYAIEDIVWIARQFQVDGPIEIGPFPGRGNINLHTYQVVGADREYLLQKVNSDVFAMPYRVMNSMLATVQAQRNSLAVGKGDPLWVPIDLVPTRKGQPFLDLTDVHGWSVWRMMVRIPASVCYKSLGEVDDRPRQIALSREVGRGLAIYSDLTSNIDPTAIEGSLPGYRDTGLYYGQFHSVMANSRTLGDACSFLPQDPILKSSTEQHFVVACDEAEYRRRKSDPELRPYIQLAIENEPFAMGLWAAMEDGTIRNTLIHGDTKIENFLFCDSTGRVKSLVDLDTIMPFTWLADYGDLQRSMVNVAGEKERNLNKVQVDKDVYEAVARGFLETATEITTGERSLMATSVEIITLELGVRFLTDYLRGDSYFQLGEDDPRDLNKVRAMVQLTLFKRLVEFRAQAEQIVAGVR